MSGKVYQILFLVLMLNLNIYQGVFGDESSVESQPHYEYTQIFKSIPALFEYLFDALEERPEILEKNDVTMFGRNIYGLDTDKTDNSDHDSNVKKRNIDCNDHRLQDVSETTVAYEYGNSNVVMKDVDETESHEISKQFANNEDVKRNKKEIPKKANRINNRKKINHMSNTYDDVHIKFNKHGDAFPGFKKSFGLDLKPEDIEERILTAEKLLEEYNNKED